MDCRLAPWLRNEPALCTACPAWLSDTTSRSIRRQPPSNMPAARAQPRRTLRQRDAASSPIRPGPPRSSKFRARCGRRSACEALPRPARRGTDMSLADEKRASVVRRCYSGARSSPSSQPFTVSDRRGSASAAIFLKSASRSNPLRSVSGRIATDGTLCRCESTWKIIMTLT